MFCHDCFFCYDYLSERSSGPDQPLCMGLFIMFCYEVTHYRLSGLVICIDIVHVLHVVTTVVDER